MPQATHNINDYIEGVIDNVGIADVLGMVAYICSEKADHIRFSYGDDDLAEKWTAVEKALVRIAEECEL